MTERVSWLRKQLEALIRRDNPVVNEEALKKRIDDYYLPMFEWTEEVVNSVQAKNQSAKQSCVCMGLSCVQGGGKTTMSRYMEEMLTLTGKKCAVISLDDVYLERKQQIALAEANPDNPLLQYRGNPGTQDLKLLMDFIHDCKTSEGEILVPRYDKSMHNGRGDRAPRSKWDKTTGPLDVLLIEGWCMGFQALKPTSSAISDHLRPINAALEEFEQLYDQLDALIVIKVAHLDWIYKWREEPEEKLRRANKPAMTPDEVRDFIDRFMPAYKAYLPKLYADPKSGDVTSPASHSSSTNLMKIPRLVISIDESRSPLPILKPLEFNFAAESLAQ